MQHFPAGTLVVAGVSPILVGLVDGQEEPTPATLIPPAALHAAASTMSANDAGTSWKNPVIRMKRKAADGKFFIILFLVSSEV